MTMFTNEMLSAMRDNWTGFGGLSQEMREFIKDNWADCRIRHKDRWQSPWFIFSAIDDGCVVRLRLQFEPPIEPPEGYRLVTDEDGKKHGYMTYEEIENLYFSCSFALQELEAMEMSEYC